MQRQREAAGSEARGPGFRAAFLLSGIPQSWRKPRRRPLPWSLARAVSLCGAFGFIELLVSVCAAGNVCIEAAGRPRPDEKCLLTVRIMTSMAILPLLFGCVGIFSLFKLLQCMWTKASLQDAVVVITECAKVFYAAGAKLVLCGRNREALEELTKELAASQATKVQTHKPFTVTFDLTDPGAIIAATAEILQCFGYVDVLINNAGVSYRGAILDTTTDVDKRVMETNYFGPVALTKALLPSMIKRRHGHIVVISSIQGKISIPFRSAYAASKHATQAFFDCLRAEMEQYQIKVTIISPGYIHTNLSLNAITADGSRYGVMDKTTAQGRMPMEVARDVLTAVVKKKKDVILADLLPSLAIYLRTLAPGLFFSLMASRARREQKSKNS